MWRVAAATESRRRAFHETDYDDWRWAPMPVPGHWSQGAQVGESDLAIEESVLYRREFEGPDVLGAFDSSVAPQLDVNDESRETDDSKRWWLRLEGIAQQSDVWLDGSYLGHTDGYFVPHEFEASEQIAARSEHLLAIDVTCRRFGDPDNRTTLTGALQDPELCGAEDLIIGGIWRPVRLRSTGRIAIRHARVVCAEVRTSSRRARRADQPRARLAMRVVLDAPGGGSVELRTRVAGTEHLHSHHAADGENRVEWTVDVDDPPLWWPHSLGEQPLCDLTLEAVDAESSQVHDQRCLRIGFRSVTMRRWVLHVNDERLFAKGANLLPVRRLIGTASASEAAADVHAAREAGLDLVRPVAHIARPELYDAADASGMLIWQDLPMRGLMSRGLAGDARRQTREAVDLLGHRPSLVLWCAHDEPFARPTRRSAAPVAASTQRPSWNRDVLDRRICRVLERCDGSRPVVAHTAVPPRLPRLDGTTSQFWYGLHGGRAADLSATLARIPAMARFVSAFGTHVSADQPEVVKTTIETLRRLKYRPAGGFLLHALADVGSAPEDAQATPSVGFGVLDSLHRPKPGWQALLEACQPVIVTADPLPELLHGGDRVNLAVHVVNDTRDELDGIEASARLVSRGDSDVGGDVVSEHRWAGSVAADDCVFVGRIDAQIPQGLAGELTVELKLIRAATSDDPSSSPQILATNQYSAAIAEPA